MKSSRLNLVHRRMMSWRSSQPWWDVHEEKHFPVGMPHPVEAIRIRMADLGLRRKDLMEHLGKSSGRVSDILNCRRALTLGDVRTLSSLLHLPAEVLLQEYSLEEGKPKETLRSTGSAATC